MVTNASNNVTTVTTRRSICEEKSMILFPLVAQQTILLGCSLLRNLVLFLKIDAFSCLELTEILANGVLHPYYPV